MPEIVFFNSKSGELTCTANGISLHSKYNPIQEAQRFIQNLSVDFKPKYIVITEPGLFYCKEFLEEKFPDTLIYSIHYSSELYSKSQNKNKILADTISKAECFNTTLFNLLGEEGILSALFLSWSPSSNAFSEIDKIIWEKIKASVELSRTIIATRSHFSSRWIVNCIKNLIHTENTFAAKKINKPIVICASGPSLEGCFKILNKLHSKLFLLAVSSAASALIKNNIIPDAVISTDGGYWAKKHLEILKKYEKIPLILASEGNCPLQVLKQNPVIFLSYPDGIASEIIKKAGFNGITGERNGTVSGTALDLAKKITDSEIFAFGLDLSPAPGFQHAQPNTIEIQNLQKDYRIKTGENRITSSRYNSGSLKIYEEWFKSLPFEYTKNIFRVSDNYNFTNKLGFIKDIKLDEFSKKIMQINEFSNEFFYERIKNSKNKENLKKSILKLSETEEWKKEFFTAEYIAFEKEINSSKKDALFSKISDKNKVLVNKILRIIK